MLSFRSKCAIELNVRSLGHANPEGLEFVTFTLPGGGHDMTIEDFSAMYRRLWNCWRYRLRIHESSGIRIWERHQSGGFHVHVLVPVGRGARMIAVAQANGWGRCHVAIVHDLEGMGGYMARELAKGRQKDFSACGRQVRVWAAWGVSRVVCAGVVVDSVVSRHLKQWRGLGRKSRWRVMCALSRLDSQGYLPEQGVLSVYKQWRLVRAVAKQRSPLRAIEGDALCSL